MEPSTFVMDAWAFMALMRDERPASLDVMDVLGEAEKGQVRVAMSIVNQGEVYYRLMRLAGREAAEAFVRSIDGLPVETVVVDHELVWEAARLKASYAISYADAFAAALAIRLNATLVTGDPDFASLAEAGLLNVRWLTRAANQQR